VNINLLYLSDSTYGGWMTYTYHLVQALQVAPNPVSITIKKIRSTDYRIAKDFGYGLHYYGRRLETLLQEETAPSAITIIVAIHKNYRSVAQELFRAKPRCILILHDYNELGKLGADVSECVVIRPVNKKLVPGSVYIPHPYKPATINQQYQIRKTMHARSINRIDFDKHTEMALLANKLLPANKQIDIRGCENNRIYSKFKLEKLGFTQNSRRPMNQRTGFSREADAAVGLLSHVRYMVDMSAIKGDGGGTQYTFLEAMDAEACCVLNQAWFQVPGEMIPGTNCLAAATSDELANILQKTKEVQRQQIVLTAKETTLAAHDYKKIGRQYKQFLQNRNFI